MATGEARPVCPACGRPGRPKADTVAQAAAMVGLTPLEACRRMQMRPASVARALYRGGRPDLARRFSVVATRLRKAGDSR